MSYAVLQRRASAPAVPVHVPESVREVLRQPGQPLPAETRRVMEARFGHDFSLVRVHTDATAERSARDTRAEAWTVGRDIAFGANRWHPDTPEGYRLLAHELTHVLQQGGASVSSGAELAVSDAGEREASAAETSALPGSVVASVAPSLRCQETSLWQRSPEREEAFKLSDLAHDVNAAIENGGYKLDELLMPVRGWVAKNALIGAYAELTRPGEERKDLRTDIIKKVPRGKVMVDSLVLMRNDASRLHSPEVKLARAIIPTSVSDTDALDTISDLKTLDVRQRMEEEYNATFWGIWEMRKAGCPLSPDKDGLLMHLHYSLTNLGKWKWRFHKCWALLDRDLNTADHIYFESVAIPDKHRDALVDYFLTTYRNAGYGGIDQLNRWWDGYISGTGLWKHNPPMMRWARSDLRESMREELHCTGMAETPADASPVLARISDVLTEAAWKVAGSTKTYRAIMTILDEAAQRKRQIARDASKPVAADPVAAKNEEIRRNAYSAARVESRIIEVNKGPLDYFHNQQQLAAAARQLRTRHQQQLTGLQPGSPDWNAVQARYASRRKEALEGVNEQVVADTGTFDAMQSSLSPDLASAEADFSLADELYAARGDADQMVALSTKYWVQDRIGELWRQAGSSKDYGGAAHRPKYRPDVLMSNRHEAPFMRYTAMVSLSHKGADSNQFTRGAARLQYELEYALNTFRSDSALGDLVKFFSTPGFSVDLRGRVIDAWEQEYLSPSESAMMIEVVGGTPVDRFLGRLASEFEGKANTWLDLADLLDPVTTKSSPEKAAKRAQSRRKALHRSWANPAAMMTAVYDAATGERFSEHVEENAARLQFIADNYRTNKEALAAMLYISGGSVEELAAQNFRLSEKQARDLKDMQNTCAEMFVSTLETVAELVAGAVTGGAGMAPLIKSLAIAMAGMGLRESMMGEDYQLFSAANFKSLVNTGLSFAYLRLDVRKRVADRWSNKNMPGVQRLYDTDKEMGKALAGFVQCGAQKFFETGVSTVAGVTMDSLIFDKAIRPQDIANLGANLLISILAGGTAGSQVINHHPGLIHALLDPSTLMKEALLFRGGLSLNSIGKQISALVQGGVGNKTVVDILGTFTASLARTMATTFLSAPFDVEDLRREMQKSVRFALQVVKDPARVEALSGDFTNATRRKKFKEVNGERVLVQDANPRDLKTQRAYADKVAKAPEGKKPTYTQHIADRAVFEREVGDFMDMLKPGIEERNKGKVRSGPIWERDRDGKLEELQTDLRTALRAMTTLAQKPPE